MTYRHLTQEERYQIDILLRTGFTCSAVAQQLGRHPSTIVRERRRNANAGRYRAEHAQRVSQARRYNASSRPRLLPEVMSQIEQGMSQRWSPVQIQGRCRVLELPVASHTSIYRYIHRHGLRSQLRSPKRRRKYGAQRPDRFADRKPISERPSIVEAGTRLGDWEMDTVRPAKGRGVLVTLNERLSGLLRLGWSPTGKAEDVADTVVSCLMPDRSQVHTLTSDRGSEFADGNLIEISLEAQMYMADPHAPWQRARNENLNGLLRQYFPRKRDFSTITQKEIQAAEDELNQRPRKRHGFLTPLEVFYYYKRVALRS